MSKTLLMCRAGFESDLAAEIQEKSAQVGIAGFVRAKANSGFVVFENVTDEDANALHKRLRFEDLVFARQWLKIIKHLEQLDPSDRVSPIIDCLRDHSVQDFWLSFPDTNQGKSLSKLARKLEQPLNRAAKGLLQSATHRHAHLFFLSGTEIWLGITDDRNASSWPMGFPRLRQPAAAPSRSTLKLEEAWMQFIGESQRAELLRPFLKAVDLGAAPGGWTWQLVNRGMQVVAIDNGPMDKTLMESGQVTHLREDAFSYRPPRNVDWLVCDMVEKPARVAQLMERWLTEGWTRFAIFNLKLPMKRRWLEVSQILQRMQSELETHGRRYQLRAKQLYHDREEITVFAQPL